MTEGAVNDAERDTGTHPIEVPSAKSRRAFAKVRRELSEEELSSPGAQRFLLDELEQLEEELDDLERYRDLYYAADKERAVLSEKLKVQVAADVVFGVCLTIGAALVGIAPALWANSAYGAACLSMGFALMAGGIVAKVVRYER